VLRAFFVFFKKKGTMKKIEILGHELAVEFNMAVQLKYEELSHQPFDLETMTTQTATMQLCYASLEIANSKLPFSYDEMNRKMTLNETATLKNAVIETMNEWMQIPEVMKSDEPVETESEKND
jgi:hypothetical protein